jgi:hypothetical protein
MGELLPATVAHDVAGVLFLDCPGRRYVWLVAQEAEGASGRVNKQLQANTVSRHKAAFLFDGLELKILRCSVTNFAAFRRGRFSFEPISNHAIFID